ncbi:MAG: dolichyl-phosphate beta-glucosyltransferase [Candidatus Woesearchaeota archaeon]
MDLSVVIPVYNEQDCIANTITTVQHYLTQQHISYEIIVVNDCSTDKTRSIVSSLKNITVLHNKKNKGKGYSVKKGILHAQGKYILFSDADLSTPISELKTFMELITTYDIVIASRALKEAQVKTRWFKKLFGRVSWLAIHLLAVKNIKDTQCGFKLFKKSVAHHICSLQTIERWGFDFELLFIAQKYKYTIKEQPVTWIENTDSKVRLRDYPKTLLELLSIRIKDIQGRYK